MTLTKMDLVENLMEYGLARADAKQFVELMFEEMVKTLCLGQTVRISGFGNFEPRFKKERPGHDFKERTSTSVPERWVVIFKGGQKLRKRVETCPVVPAG
ncbi:MAG: HU family DNA-binding protein [Pseudomonadota bacterium]